MSWNLSPWVVLKLKGLLRNGIPNVENLEEDEGCTSIYFHWDAQSIQEYRIKSLVCASKNGKS